MFVLFNVYCRKCINQNVKKNYIRCFEKMRIYGRLKERNVFFYDIGNCRKRGEGYSC